MIAIIFVTIVAAVRLPPSNPVLKYHSTKNGDIGRMMNQRIICTNHRGDAMEETETLKTLLHIYCGFLHSSFYHIITSAAFLIELF